MIPRWILTIFAASLLVRSTTATCCSCVPDRPPFVETASEAPVVALVEVRRIFGAWRKGTPRYAELIVKRYLKGALDTNTLILEGDNGVQCRFYASHFAPGTAWVVALDRVPKFNVNKPRYEASRCSESALFFDGASVTGLISTPHAGAGDESPASMRETIHIDELVERLYQSTRQP